MAEAYGWLDGLFAAGQALVFMSLIYFFYVVIRFGGMLQDAASDDGRRVAREAGRDACVDLWVGEPEHGRTRLSAQQATGPGWDLGVARP